MAHSQLTPQRRIVALAAVAALHAGGLALILLYTPTTRHRAVGAPIRVSLVQAMPTVAPPESRPPKPVPDRRARHSARPKAPPLIATPASGPAPVSVVPAAVAESTPAKQATAPALKAPQTPGLAAEPVAAAPAEPAPVVPPSFNANYLDNPPPAYPSLSRRMGEEGRVMLRVFVNEQGAADRVELRTSSGHVRLDEVALDTVRRWKFVPARRGNEPIGAWVVVPISFNLRS